MKNSLFVFAIVCFAAHASAQSCYPTMLADKSKGITTTFTYDNAQNITSVSTSSPWGKMAYTAATEKTPTGTKKTFTLASVDPALKPMALNKTIVTYNNKNQLVYIEGSSDAMRSTEKYSYNNFDQLTEIIQETRDASGKIADQGKLAYTYPNSTSKNPSGLKTYGIYNDKPGLTLLEDATFTYDTNKSVSDEFPFSSGPFRTYAANNILTVSVNYVTSKNTVNQTYAYQFNAQGYPTSKTYKFSGDDTTDSYEYACK